MQLTASFVIHKVHYLHNVDVEAPLISLEPCACIASQIISIFCTFPLQYRTACMSELYSFASPLSKRLPLESLLLGCFILLSYWHTSFLSFSNSFFHFNNFIIADPSLTTCVFQRPNRSAHSDWFINSQFFSQKVNGAIQHISEIPRIWKPIKLS